MKPIYKILAVVGVVIILGIGVYLGWNKIISPPVPPATPTNGESVGGAAASEKKPPIPKKLSDYPVFDYWTVQATKEIYYVTPQGEVWSAKEGPDLKIASGNFTALNSIEAALGGRRVIAGFGDPRRPGWGIFDLGDGVWRPLPEDILDAVWGGNENTLYGFIKSGGGISLAEIDVSKNPPVSKTLIKDFRLKDIDLAWRPPENLLIVEKPSFIYPARVWQLDLKTLTFNLLLAPEKGLVLKPAGEGSLLKFSPPKTLSLLDSDLTPSIPESTFLTLPSKCTVFASVLYCFEPQDIPRFTNLPDDYFQRKFYSIDNLFSLDLKSYKLEKILVSNENGVPAIDAYNPQVLNSNIYFVNRYDDSLYSTRTEF